MAVPRRGAPRAFRGRQRAATNWSRSIQNPVVSVPQGTKVLIATMVLSNQGIGETIRRTRGIVQVHSDQSSAVEAQTGAFGMIVVSDLAIAAGAASIPGPATEAEDDGWFVWQGFVQTGASAPLSNTETGYAFDSKAMRRIEEGFGVAMMIENFSGTGGEDFTAGLAVSILTSLS